MKNLITKIGNSKIGRAFVEAVLVGALGTACAPGLILDSPQSRGYATREEAMEVLGIRHPSLMSDLEGYKMSSVTAAQMRALAALKSGKEHVTQNTQVYKDGNTTTTVTRTSSSTTYTWGDRENLREILQEAETDGDWIIDRNEERVIQNKIYSQYANQKR